MFTSRVGCVQINLKFSVSRHSDKITKIKYLKLDKEYSVRIERNLVNFVMIVALEILWKLRISEKSRK